MQVTRQRRLRFSPPSSPTGDVPLPTSHRGMASTPDTSFSSSPESPRGRSRKTVRDASVVTSLPSPQPSVCHDPLDEAYRAVWDHFCGLPTAESLLADLGDQATFEALYDRLDTHPGLLRHFEGIWKEWDADTGRLLLRLVPMARPIHEVLKMQLDKTIETELDRIAGELPTLRPLHQKILSAGHTHIKKRQRSPARAPDFWKVPDGQVFFADHSYPPFLFEIAYSQSEEELNETIKTYFKKFPGKICTILALKIQYPDVGQARDYVHPASVSLWTSILSDNKNLRIQRVLAAPFRDNKGIALPGAVVIPLASFLPLQARDQHEIPSTASLRLGFADLVRFVEQGEARQRIADKSASRSPTPTEPQFKIQFTDEAGAVEEEYTIPPKKRRKTADTSRQRTRSQSQPIRSSRLASRSRAGTT